jgi:hypothetical protein
LISLILKIGDGIEPSDFVVVVLAAGAATFLGAAFFGATFLGAAFFALAII